MMILDTHLKRREAAGEPIRVALVGGGYMSRGIAHQLLTPITGMRLVAIANRTPARAERIWQEHGRDVVRVDSASALDDAIDSGRAAVADDYRAICQAESIDVVVETTGHVEFGAHVAISAIENRKHIVLVNAELDATVGPILQRKAEQAGVVYTNVDGDEPGVAMNLYRFVETLGYRPVMAGNIKGFIDTKRTPDTQRAFAERYGQDPPMITSFADGTKLSMECCILANATGLSAGQRGMFGPSCEHVRDIAGHFDADDLLARPLVDYALGAQPGTGAFVVGYNDEPVKQQYMNYFKFGDGPLYVFYTPYHLPHLQVAVTIGRVALFHDAAVAPLGAPVCEVVAVAKKSLQAGDKLDGIGGFACYGQLENSSIARRENLLPMGLSEHCTVVREVAIDTPLRLDDVELPAGRLCDRLWREQRAMFAGGAADFAPVDFITQSSIHSPCSGT
jgi:predicted homoserine dehydrogenase-like protein